MFDRINRQMTNSDEVAIVVNTNLESVGKNAVPTFAGDGYSASKLANGWHALFKDPEIFAEKLTDHIYLVNQHSGQQIVLKMLPAKPTPADFIAFEPEYDQISKESGNLEHALVYTPEQQGPGIVWKCSDLTVGSTPDRQNFFRCGNVFVNAAIIGLANFETLWATKFSYVEPPKIDERCELVKKYTQLKYDMAAGK